MASIETIVDKDILLKALGSVGNLEGQLLGLSDEYRSFLASGYKCPGCGRSLWKNVPWNPTMNYYSADGEKLPLWRFISSKIVECSHCSYRWKVWAKDSTVSFEMVETEREEEGFGTDKRILDNSKSTVTFTRKFSISKEWSRSYVIEYERATVGNLGVSGQGKVLGFSAGIEAAVKERFSLTDTAREVCSEEISVDVPALTKLVVLLHWKKIWQHGFVRFTTLNNENSIVPFKVVVGVTFDQSEVDEPV